MGSVQSSQTQEDGQNTNIQLVTNNVKSLELDEVSFSKPVYPPLKQMLNWSLQEIRIVYEKFQRRSATNSPFVDKVFFCKLVPFTRSNAAYIFDSFSRKKEFISIYEFLCILTICSYTHFINKIHFFYILFDLDCGGDISLNELLIVFKSTITGYCKLTDSTLPNPHKLEKFAKLMFLKSDIQADNALELKEIIEWCEGNARAMELFARFEPKYKIKEKYEVFKNFKPYPEEIGHNMLKQINKANHDETYLDELSEIMKKDKANSYMKNTSSFNTYQQELRMERSMTTDQIKKSYQNKSINKMSNSDQKNNALKSQTSIIDQSKFFQKIQQTQPTHTENVDDENDDVKNLDIALFSHQTIFKVKNDKDETQTKFPKLCKTSNSLHQSSSTIQKTRIQTYEGQISRQEILKLMDYFEFLKFREKVLQSRIENQKKREEQNQKQESDTKMRIQKEIEDEEYQKKINPKKVRSVTQDTKNQSKQMQEFQKKENLKNDKIREEKEFLEDQKLQIDLDQKLQDYLLVCLFKKDIKELEKIKLYLQSFSIEKLQEINYEIIILNIYQFLMQMDKAHKEEVLKTILHWFTPQQQRQPKNIIITKGTAITKQEIFKLKEYFDFLSDKEKTIKINKFSKAMQDKRHMKRVSQSLFQYLDPQQTTEITFDQLLVGIYPSLQSKDIQTINSWVRIYQKTFDMQSKDIKVVQNEEDTKPIIKKKKILPSSTLIRIKEIYNNLDEERKGFVTIDNIRHKFTYGFTHKDIEKLFDMYDTNKDGVLEVPDFAKMILPPDYTIEGIE